ncbi:MAG: glycosyltransferase family 2 protein [Pseudomonadota bacterium]
MNHKDIHPNPKISVITVCFNAQTTIAHTIHSVLNQSYKNLELLICDGCSSDKTIATVQQFTDPRIKLVSEPDSGLYDAINKGIKRATGEIIHILNADDQYASTDVLENIAALFMNNSIPIDIVYSGIRYINDQGDNLDEWRPNTFFHGSYVKGFHTPHPGFFTTCQTYDRLGLYNTDFKVAADFDLMLRFMEDEKIHSHKLDAITVLMRADGRSSTLSGILNGFFEVRRSLEDNNQDIGLIPFVYRRYAPKVRGKFFRLFQAVFGRFLELGNLKLFH